MATRRSAEDIEARVQKKLASKRARLVKADKYLPAYIDEQVKAAEAGIRDTEELRASYKFMEDVGKEAGVPNDDGNFGPSKGFFLRPCYNLPQHQATEWLQNSIAATHTDEGIEAYRTATVEVAFYSNDKKEGNALADKFEEALKANGVTYLRSVNPGNGGKPVILVDA